MSEIIIPQVFFSRSAFMQMATIAEKSPDTETGGLVLGKIRQYHSGRALVVMKISGPGPQARLEPHGFHPDIEHYRHVLRDNPDWQYLGEWHKHPQDQIYWSRQDYRQARQIFADEGVSELLCPICVCPTGNACSPRIEMRCFYLHSSMGRFVPVAYAVIDDESSDWAPLHYLAVSKEVVHKFIASRRRYTVVGGDEDHRAGVAHLYASPFRDNLRLLLINGRRCKKLPIAEECRVAIVVESRRGRTAQVRAYSLEANYSREITVEVVSTKADIFIRNQALLETEQLNGKHVAIIGLGSIGSVAALELARAGVTRFTLIDPDSVRIHNLCRHICDLTDLGLTKVEAVARRIAKILPYAEIATYAIDANHDPDATSRYCAKVQAILVATDTENSRHLANWIAHRHQIPTVFAGLLERAVGGRVWRVVPGQTACYECYPAVQQPTVNQTVAYSQVQSPRDLTIQPGLGNDIAFVTHLAVRYVIDLLSGEQQPPAIVFWFNRAKERWCEDGLSLYKVDQAPANPDCYFCRDRVDPVTELR